MFELSPIFYRLLRRSQHDGIEIYRETMASIGTPLVDLVNSDSLIVLTYYNCCIVAVPVDVMANRTPPHFWKIKRLGMLKV